MIADYAEEGHRDVDIFTAGAIWAGTLDANSIYRHVCFRRLKRAADAGLIVVTALNGPSPNKSTMIALDSLGTFLGAKCHRSGSPQTPWDEGW
jgi:hypothetical protein